MGQTQNDGMAIFVVHIHTGDGMRDLILTSKGMIEAFSPQALLSKSSSHAGN